MHFHVKDFPPEKPAEQLFQLGMEAGCLIVGVGAPVATVVVVVVVVVAVVVVVVAAGVVVVVVVL